MISRRVRWPTPRAPFAIATPAWARMAGCWSSGRARTIDGAIRLINSDGSDAEISGNGTRCAAAFLIYQGLKGNEIRIMTGAGIKHLRLLSRDGLVFQMEMNMGQPEIRQRNFSLPLAGGVRDVTIVWVGNPQCAVPVDNFDFDWRTSARRSKLIRIFRSAPTCLFSARSTRTRSMSASTSVAPVKR